jgi:uncharacterized double-CXXCG motif protein
MPGVHCPLCGAIWNTPALAYPCVDLSGHPERHRFEKPRLEDDFSEFERLCALVRPLMPPRALLQPGTSFGSLVGTATGRLGPLVLLPSDFHLLTSPNTLAALQSEGVRGLLACPAELRSRRKEQPELLELQIESHGLLHPDCLPPGKAAPCAKCGRYDFSLPREPILDAASLPLHLDVFRLANFGTVLVATERFKEAVERHAPHCLSFRELPLR